MCVGYAKDFHKYTTVWVGMYVLDIFYIRFVNKEFIGIKRLFHTCAYKQFHVRNKKKENGPVLKGTNVHFPKF